MLHFSMLLLQLPLDKGGLVLLLSPLLVQLVAEFVYFASHFSVKEDICLILLELEFVQV